MRETINLARLILILLITLHVHHISIASSADCKTSLQMCKNRRQSLQTRFNKVNSVICNVSARANRKTELDFAVQCYQKKIDSPCSPFPKCKYFYGPASRSARRYRAVSESYTYQCYSNGKQLELIKVDPNNCNKTLQSCEKIEKDTNICIEKNIKSIQILKSEYNDTEIARLEKIEKDLKERLTTKLSNTACPEKTSYNGWEYWAQWG